jgi:predicted nicotinamide N-methyase
MGGSLRHGRAYACAEVMSPDAARRFILQNTSVLSPPHAPEIRLHLAHEVHELWHKTEEDLCEIGLPPPFWAFAWAGGQGLARYILDNPHVAAGRSVIDFASGSGLVGIAAKRAGAHRVQCVDIDAYAQFAAAMNAELNEVAIEPVTTDLMNMVPEADLILAGDVFYDRIFASELIPWFENCARNGIQIFVGDPDRSYFPKNKFTLLASYEVPVTRALEDAEVKHTTVWRFNGN